jgi:hypothetical protein
MRRRRRAMGRSAAPAMLKVRDKSTDFTSPPMMAYVVPLEVGEARSISLAGDVPAFFESRRG